MKKSFTVTIDTETRKITIISPDGTVEVDGVILFAGNNDQQYVLHWGAYDPMVAAFYKALADPNFQGFAEALKRTRTQKITADEAEEKWSEKCCGHCKTLH